MRQPRMKPLGQVRAYGILVGKVKEGQMNPHGNSAHYEIWVQADDDYLVAVDVAGCGLLAFYDPNFTKPTKLDLPARAAGSPEFTLLSTGQCGQGLDYLRDRLFPVGTMGRVADHGGMSLANLLDAQVKRAKADDEAVVLACGELFDDNCPDSRFAFSPGRTIRGIHMMQGNEGLFADDNRVNGDGALFFRYAGGETVALFVRFASQGIPTNDCNGVPQ